MPRRQGAKNGRGKEKRKICSVCSRTLTPYQETQFLLSHASAHQILKYSESHHLASCASLFKVLHCLRTSPPHPVPPSQEPSLLQVSPCAV